jgi:hypothetical protein
MLSSNSPPAGYERVNEQTEKIKALATQYGDMAGKKFGGLWKLGFFTCGACTLASGIISIIGAVASLASPFDFINYCYLTLFGAIMCALDIPLQMPLLKSFRTNMFTYCLFLTRFLGRGVFYLFLSAMIVGGLWDNDMCPFLGFILGGVVAGIAILSLIKGVELTQRLESVRKVVLEQGPEAWGSYIPPTGLKKKQFQDLALSLKGVSFSEEEMNYIVAGFSQDINNDDVIQKEEFTEWTREMIIL